MHILCRNTPLHLSLALTHGPKTRWPLPYLPPSHFPLPTHIIAHTVASAHAHTHTYHIFTLFLQHTCTSLGPTHNHAMKSQPDACQIQLSGCLGVYALRCGCVDECVCMRICVYVCECVGGGRCACAPESWKPQYDLCALENGKRAITSSERTSKTLTV